MSKILVIIIIFVCFGIIANSNSNIGDENPKVLVFEEFIGGLYIYRLEFNGENVTISYTYDNHDPIIQEGQFTNGKIIVDGCEYCYVLSSDTSLCVYNSETDSQDCYCYNPINSTHTVMDLN